MFTKATFFLKQLIEKIGISFNDAFPKRKKRGYGFDELMERQRIGRVERKGQSPGVYLILGETGKGITKGVPPNSDMNVRDYPSTDNV